MQEVKHTHITDFTQGSVSKHLFKFAMPLFLSSLLQVVYNMVDMIVVGQAMGKVGLSAVSVGGDVSNFLTFLAMGFCNAGQVIISQYIGAGKKDKIGRFISTMFSSLTVFSVIIGIVCLIFRHPILRLMNTPDAAYGEALAYSTVCIAGVVFIYGYNIVSAILRGMGDSKHPFVFISLAAVLNAILDVVFVFGFDMGAGGAALATVISQAVSFISCAVFILKRKKEFEISVKFSDFTHIDFGMLGSLTKLGVPMAIKSASIHFSKLFVNSWINSYGVAISAFAGVANKINSMSNLLSNSMNTAGSSMVGQNVGAGKYERVPKIMWTLFSWVFVLASIFTAATFFFPMQVFGIFTKDASVLEIALDYLPVAAFIFYGSAARSPMNALINGSGNYKVNFATAILDGIVMRIGLSVLFGLVLDMKHIGFWLGDALAGFTPLWIGLVFYFSGKWKKKTV